MIKFKTEDIASQINMHPMINVLVCQGSDLLYLPYIHDMELASQIRLHTMIKQQIMHHKLNRIS